MLPAITREGAVSISCSRWLSRPTINGSKLRRGRWARNQLSIPRGISSSCLHGTPGEPGYLSRGGPRKNGVEEKYEMSLWPTNRFRNLTLNNWLKRLRTEGKLHRLTGDLINSSKRVCEISNILPWVFYIIRLRTWQRAYCIFRVHEIFNTLLLVFSIIRLHIRLWSSD